MTHRFTFSDIPVIDGIITVEPGMYAIMSDDDKSYIDTICADAGLNVRAVSTLELMVSGDARYKVDGVENGEAITSLVIDRADLKPLKATVYIHHSYVKA